MTDAETGSSRSTGWHLATAVQMPSGAVRKVTDVDPEDVEAILKAALKNFLNFLEHI